jgi:hypothetical protein
MSDAIDDGKISDEACLLRRIPPEQVVIDKNKGCPRPSSAAFKDPKLSVDAEPILHSQGLDSTFSVLNYPAHSLVRFTAKAARELQLPVIPDPLPDNKSHTLVLGKKTQGKANKLRDSSTWVRCLPP